MKKIFLTVLIISIFVTKVVSSQETKCQLWQWTTTLQLTDTTRKNYSVSPYLWIPPTCAKLNAVVFASTAVIEQVLVESPEIRSVCAKQGIAIVWSDTQFYHDEITGLKQIQDILNKFAALSGYNELKTVPWIPIGHSATLKMIRDMAKLKMDKLAFMIMNKNNNGFGFSSSVPTLITYGEYVEWDSYDIDLKAPITKEKSYPNLIKSRTDNHLLVSYFFDPNTGHFDCSKALIHNIAEWMHAICALRFDSKGNLKTISQDQGWVCQPIVPGYKGFTPIKYTNATESERNNAWFPTYETAISAYNMANVSMNRTAQIAGFADANGNYEKGWWRAIMYDIPYILNNDGTLTINAVPYYKMPQGSFPNKFTDDKNSPDFGKLYSFYNRNDEFSNSGNPLQVENMSGNLIKIDNHTFEYVPRFDSPNYLIVREEGNEKYRNSIQPGRLNFKNSTEGKENVISFPKIENQKLEKLKPIILNAKASSGLKVKYFVKSGAARIDKNNRLIIEPESSGNDKISLFDNSYRISTRFNER